MFNNKQDISAELVSFLKTNSFDRRIFTCRDVVFSWGKYTKAAINTSLYDLQRKGILNKQDGRPPVWCFVHSGTRSDTRDEERAFNSNTSGVDGEIDNLCANLVPIAITAPIPNLGVPISRDPTKSAFSKVSKDNFENKNSIAYDNSISLFSTNTSHLGRDT